MPCTDSDNSPGPRAHFVHPLLRARDWQDGPEFAELCDWWRSGSSLSSAIKERAGMRSRNEPGTRTLGEAAADDPRLAAVKEQERKFGRLAQRYRDALAARDPAALALMGRVCLFRLGVNADTLAAIFTDAGKETVSGPPLAAPNQQHCLQPA